MPILKFPGTVWYFSLWYKHCLKSFWVYCRIIFLKQVFDILRLNGKKKLSRGKISRGSISVLNMNWKDSTKKSVILMCNMRRQNRNLLSTSVYNCKREVWQRRKCNFANLLLKDNWSSYLRRYFDVFRRFINVVVFAGSLTTLNHTIATFFFFSFWHYSLSTLFLRSS